MNFSMGELELSEFDDVVIDLVFEIIEVLLDGGIVLYFIDSCGEYFFEEYWLVVYFGVDGVVEKVIVEF